ncbi:unnamed protein product [Vicia faba]|uniref:Glutathione S-transferase n=1 Tax=Vicia faba TaxID=3906 RepID=A0AAV1A2I7_VICFA|nr:unnamed protein product [Vicia faba]
MLIVEYIDEIWTHNSLLPDDSYDRAQARFWVKYVDDMEDMFEVKILQSERFPRLKLWFTNIKDVPVIKENTPGQEKSVVFLKPFLEKMLARK